MILLQQERHRHFRPGRLSLRDDEIVAVARDDGQPETGARRAARTKSVTPVSDGDVQCAIPDGDREVDRARLPGRVGMNDGVGDRLGYRASNPPAQPAVRTVSGRQVDDLPAEFPDDLGRR